MPNLIHDPQEDDPALKKIIDQAERESEEILAKQKVVKTRGYCHKLWPEMKRILKEKHVDWKSPADLNPEILFD